jgi:hypothetical protein
MGTTTQHTPGPWKFNDNGIYLGNAHWIAKAKTYETTRETLMQRAVKDAEHYAPDGNEPIWAFIMDASDAIAKATGGAK